MFKEVVVYGINCLTVMGVVMLGGCVVALAVAYTVKTILEMFGS